MMLITLLGLSTWFQTAGAQLPTQESDGWHSWTIDSDDSVTLYVRLKSGKPLEIRNASFNCAPVARGQTVVDHGLVSAAENIAWFRRVVENKSFNRDIRADALHGVALSDSDVAFEYLDKLLMQH